MRSGSFNFSLPGLRHGVVTAMLALLATTALADSAVAQAPAPLAPLPVVNLPLSQDPNSIRVLLSPEVETTLVSQW